MKNIQIHFKNYTRLIAIITLTLTIAVSSAIKVIDVTERLSKTAVSELNAISLRIDLHILISSDKIEALRNLIIDRH